MSDAPQTRRYATLDEAAKALACSQRTIRRLIASGDITGYRLGPRLVRVDLNEIDQMMKPIPTSELRDLLDDDEGTDE